MPAGANRPSGSYAQYSIRSPGSGGVVEGKRRTVSARSSAAPSASSFASLNAGPNSDIPTGKAGLLVNPTGTVRSGHPDMLANVRQPGGMMVASSEINRAGRDVGE